MFGEVINYLSFFLNSLLFLLELNALNGERLQNANSNFNLKFLEIQTFQRRQVCNKSW